MHASVFLIHFNPAGSQTVIPLEIYDSTCTYYLPDAPTSKLSVTRAQDTDHSSIRLDVEQNYCFLSTYSTEPRVSILLDDCEIRLPISTATHQKSVIVTESHQFITPASRWEIEFDSFDEIPGSMQPPPSPMYEGYDNHAMYIELIPSIENGILVDKNEIDDGHEVENVPIPVADIQLSPRASVSPDQDQEVEETIITNTGSNLAETSKDINEQTEEQAPLSRVEDAPISVGNIVSEYPAELEMSKSMYKSATIQPEEITDKTNRRSTPGSTSQDAEIGQNFVIAEGESESDHLRVQEDIVTCMSDTESTDDEEEIASEDESQRQRDLRIPKRRLLEIEYEQSPLRGTKMRKLGDDEDLSAKKSHKVGFKEPLDTIVVSTTSRDVSYASRDCTKKPPKAAKYKPKSSSKPESNAELGLPVSKRAATTTSTPTRRSSRQKADTPSSMTSTLFINSNYRRPAVIFGSTSEFSVDKKMEKIQTKIEKFGGTVVREIHDADVLVVGKGRLKKTSKFIIAIATGKDVVTDDWIKQACTDQKFPDRQHFMPKDIQREEEWNFSLSEALKRGKAGLRLLEDTHVYLTTQLRIDLGNLNKELKQIALALGAATVYSGLPKKKTDIDRKTLVIGSTQNIDPEAAKVERLGYKLYGQDVLTMGALRGHIDMESEEFVVQVPIKDEPIGV